jgi:hypothetical protein
MEAVSLLEILIWVTLSAQMLPLAFARGKIFTQIMLPILISPTNALSLGVNFLRR